MHYTSTTTLHKYNKIDKTYNFRLKSNKDFTLKHESGNEFQMHRTWLIKDELKTS